MLYIICYYILIIGEPKLDILNKRTVKTVRGRTVLTHFLNIYFCLYNHNHNELLRT